MKEHQQTIERIYHLLKTCPDPQKREEGEGWSVKEIVGHLVDSVSNNHQRLSRYQANGNLNFPGYDQVQFVQRAHYHTFDFAVLLSLWFNYNQLLLHIIDHLPPEELSSTVTIGDRPALTLEQLVEEYFAHLELHAQQLSKIIEY
ncbi:MAG: DinB family protein [Anaerolineae bacterium]|nr:DinB family protein [Anaerolineae bacterium]